MHYRKFLFISLIPLLAVGHSLTALAEINGSKDSSLETISLQKAIQVASTDFSGLVTLTHLESIDKMPVYIVKLESDKETNEYVIHGVTGKVLEKTHRTFNYASENSPLESYPEVKISLLEAIEIVTDQHSGAVTSTSIDVFDEIPIYLITQESDTLINERVINGVTGDIIAEVSVKATTPELIDYLTDDLIDFDKGEIDDYNDMEDFADLR